VLEPLKAGANRCARSLRIRPTHALLSELATCMAGSNSCVCRLSASRAPDLRKLSLERASSGRCLDWGTALPKIQRDLRMPANMLQRNS
jgi:hypothetical protein